MVTRSWLSVIAVGVIHLGCHQARQPPAGSLSATTAANVAPSTSSEASTVSHSAAAPSATLASTAAATQEPRSSEHPPKLKPVLTKPFPDGATDAQVCEAIANTGEKDLWLRWGHLVPLAVVGSILVIEATEADIKRIEPVVRDYRFGFWPSIKRCSSGKALLYIRDLSDDIPGGIPHGPRDLAGMLERDLGLKVTEAFGFSADQERRSDYCRIDAELCDQLVKLDYANQGQGLCSRAVYRCDVGQRDSKYRDLYGKCRQLPREQVACLEVLDGRDKSSDCEKRIRQALCPERFKRGGSGGPP
jgi:hypothetical protein